MKLADARPLGRELPADLIISRGDKISGLECIQHPRLNDFIKANRGLFIPYSPVEDAVTYAGDDMEIP